MTWCKLKMLATAAVFVGAVALTGTGAGRPAAAQDIMPVHVSFTLEGCRQESLTAGYDFEAAGFLCDAA